MVAMVRARSSTFSKLIVDVGFTAPLEHMDPAIELGDAMTLGQHVELGAMLVFGGLHRRGCWRLTY
jgi:hypothetical protein